jgi:hypothetical protein
MTQQLCLLNHAAREEKERHDDPKAESSSPAESLPIRSTAGVTVYLVPATHFKSVSRASPLYDMPTATAATLFESYAEAFFFLQHRARRDKWDDDETQGRKKKRLKNRKT